MILIGWLLFSWWLISTVSAVSWALNNRDKDLEEVGDVD